MALCGLDRRLGLKKFDGYKFTIYQHNPDIQLSLSDNDVTSITEDKKGNLWIGTGQGGLNRFDREAEKFYRYQIDTNNHQQKTSIHVLCTHMDRYGNLWIGTENRGLYLLDLESHSLNNYSHNSGDNNGPISNYICVLHEDREGDIWIGTHMGISKFNRKTKKFSHYKKYSDKQGSLSNNYIYSVTEDKFGNLFFGTQNGLNKFDKKRNIFTRYFYKPKFENAGAKNIIRCLYYAKFSDRIWMATGEGLGIFNPENEAYVNFYRNEKKYDNLENKSATSIYEDHSGIIWVGVYSGDIFKYDPNKIKFIHYKRNPENRHSLSHDHIVAIYEDSEGSLWVGTWGEGLNELRVDQRDKPFPKWITYKNDPLNTNTISNNTAWCIYEDRKKTLWIGTSGGLNKIIRSPENSSKEYDSNNAPLLVQDIPASKKLPSITCIIENRTDKLWIGTESGLFIFDRLTDTFSSCYYNNEESKNLSDSYISTIIQSKTGEIWVGTRDNGLYKIDTRKQCLSQFRYDPENPNTLSSNRVFMILEDKTGFLWITTDQGLNKYDPHTGIFMHYNSNAGLPDDATFALLDDDDGNLWISSGKGIFRYSPEYGMVRSFDVDDGLQSMDFNPCACKSKSGWMYFAGINGFNAFHPDSINYNTQIPGIILTDFRIFNKSVQTGAEAPLKKSISQAQEVILAHTQSVFSFEFAALDLHNPQKNLYAYKMEGVDQDWVYTDASRRFVTYTNLDPGEYSFRVKGSNNDGIWNEAGTSIKVIILPPWWLTYWAYALYLLFLISIVFTTWRVQLRRIHIKHQFQMEHFEADKLREVDRMKSRFFANISHEFRTPLTLIIGPVKQIMDGTFTGNLKEQCRIILRNSDRLLSLINQILDLSKLESGEIKLKVAETNIVKFVKGMVLSFSSLAESKKVILKFSSPENSMIGYVDHDKLEKIVTNLLSNSFKFTPEGGVVEVALSNRRSSDRLKNAAVTADPLKISVSNTGPGIPPEQLDKIFGRFYQVNDNYMKDNEGTGIGLALTKELVEVCHGEISVTSIPRELTTFKIELPIAKENFTEDEIVEKMETEYRRPETEDRKITIQHPASGLQHPVSSILIVEDNPDVTNYISSFMAKDYRILTAEDGKDGLKKTIGQYPDLIISDVMMPEMDGFELCKKIKSDQRISHIPVILLTAKADLDSKIEGLEFGADDYVTKPFESRELKIRSKNLIEQRRRLREKFSSLIDLRPEDIAASSMDEQLLNRLLKVFENHIEEPEFSIDQLAREIGISRIHLNRKIQAMTNHSTSDFIRTLRLQRAARLLKNASGSVSEIAYKVGFNNLSYFSKTFRKHFGKLPSDFFKEK